MLAIILSLLAIAHLVAAAATTACNANNCLRAVRASAYPTRSGTADCSSYFMVTVTPATVTYTATAFTTVTPDTTTISPSTTQTITPPLSTEIDSVTITITPAVVTVQATSYSTIKPFPSCAPQGGVAPKRDAVPRMRGSSHVRQVEQERGMNLEPPALVTAKIQARQVTTSPLLIPTYASACSGAVGYSSACSCIGVTHSTTTAIAPSTTVTQTNTITAATPTATMSLTFTTILTPLTTTVTNTATQNLVASTTTTTIISVVTDTPAPYCSFKLLVLNPGGPLDGTYVVPVPNTLSAGVGDYNTAAGEAQSASIFQCDSAAHLLYSGDYAVVGKQNSNDFFNFGAPPNSGEDRITCPIDSNGLALCNVNGGAVLQYCNYGPTIGNFLIVSTGLDLFSDGTSCTRVNLQVVPLAC